MPVPSRANICVAILAGFGLCMASVPALSQKPAEPKPDHEAFFEKEVLPVLKNNCLKCHGSGKVRGGLQLTSRDAILKGGDQGPAVTLTAPDSSRLLQALSHRDELKMPPTGKLADKDIATLTRWVKAGIPWNPKIVLSAPAAEKETARVTAEARAYWAYQPIRRQNVPGVGGARKE